MDRRVLMVSPHFPPDTSAGAHRVRLLAPHLAACGWEPTVVTVEASAYEGRLDPGLAALVPSSLRVIRAKAVSTRLTRSVGFGDLGLRSLPGLFRTCNELLGAEPYDALFVTIYPTYPALLGPGLKRRHRVPFVLDYQDPWVGSWGRDVGGGPGGTPDLKSRMTRALARRIEPPVVRAADALTAVSARTYEDALRRVPDARPRACAAIPVGFDIADIRHLRAVPRTNGWFDHRDGDVHVCYVGTLLPTGTEVLRAVLAGLKVLRDDQPELFARLRVHFLGTSNQRDPNAPARVMPVAREMGVASAVREHPARLDYLDALNVQVQAHALLVMGSVEPHYTASKVFPALLSARPIVAVCHSASTLVDILAGRPETDLLTFAANDPSSLVPALAAAWRRLAERERRPEHDRPPLPADDARLKPWSAPVLAAELARVLDLVTLQAAT